MDSPSPTPTDASLEIARLNGELHLLRGQREEALDWFAVMADFWRCECLKARPQHDNWDSVEAIEDEVWQRHLAAQQKRNHA